ncbi:hypothetical protein [Sphingomonas oryzagri]
MGFLSRLVGLFTPPELAAKSRQVGIELRYNLLPQFEILGYHLQTVPTEGEFVSPKARGALWGTALGLMKIIPPDNGDFIRTALRAAFVVTYGQAGEAIYKQTASERASNNPDIVKAADWACEDIVAVYQSDGITKAGGFVAAVEGLF